MTAAGLTVSFRSKAVLSDVSFAAEDGRVTGFVGPNGAGKSTTIRALLNLVQPDSGTVLIDGVRFADAAVPMSLAGAVLDAASVHRGRTARNHLLSLALTNGISTRRVDEVMDVCGLSSVRSRRVGTFSLGMRQRLSIAAALLGDPRNLILDEPVNGLDPEGIRWVRDLCRHYASLGRAVLLSSHLMGELAVTADDLVVIARGRIIHTSTVAMFVAAHSRPCVRISTPDIGAFGAVMESFPRATVERIFWAEEGSPDCGVFRIRNVGLSELSRALAEGHVTVHGLVEERALLESAYLELACGCGDFASWGRSCPQETQMWAGPGNREGKRVEKGR